MTHSTQAEPSVSQWFRKGQAMAQIHRKQRRTEFVLPSENQPIFLREGGKKKYEEFCDGYRNAWNSVDHVESQV